MNNPKQTVPTTDPRDSGVAICLQDYIPAQFSSDNLGTHSASNNSDTHTFSISKETWVVLDVFARSLSVSPTSILITAIRLLHFRYYRITQAAIALRPGKAGSPAAKTDFQDASLVCFPVDGDELLPILITRADEAIVQASQLSSLLLSDAITSRSKGNTVVPILVTIEDGDESPQGSSSVPEERLQFDMQWCFRPVGGQFSCDLIYDPALFDGNTIRGLAINFMDVVECMAHKSSLTVEEILFTHALEQLVEAQVPIDPVPQPPEPRGTLAEAFGKTVAQHYDRPALVDSDLILTYGQLDLLTSALAKRISDAAQGQPAYELVSFCIPPSALAIIAILGIVKYGAAYVPLDVRFPSERLEMLLGDSGARLLIMTSQSPEFSRPNHVSLLDISDILTDWRSRVASCDVAMQPSYPPHTELAYVLYTSGSTGRPKGVPIRQSSLLALVSNKETFPFSPDFTVAQLTNLAWDSSVFDVWFTLLSGSKLVCFDRYDVLDPPILAQQFKTLGINCTFMSPALVRQILNMAPHLFQSLRTLILGGEQIYYESLHKVRDINPSIVFQNACGPTEVCVVAAAFSVYSGDKMPDCGPVPIGRPLKTVQALVVDSQDRLVPPGVIGELVIAGEGVARGYLNRPAETSVSFVEMAFEGLNCRKTTFHRSGDLVRWRQDGQLQLMGRSNIGQVKIRGQRLELAEVEATIVRTGLAKEAAVAHCKPSDGRDPFLVAYVVINSELDGFDSDNTVPRSRGQLEPGSESSKVVETWRELYDDMYSSFDINEGREKFLGWDSMITGLPIPQDEMLAWLHDTLRPFFLRRPRNAFEVGCGVGKFLYEMAPFVEHIWAIEPSGEAVAGLNTQLQAKDMADKFSIWHMTADRISELPYFQSDFVLVNSVVQYMPSEAYLHDSLVQIIDKCAPGSQILLGDIRSLPLDDLLGINIILHEWRDELSCHTVQDLRNRIQGRNRNRSELLVDPGFFFELQHSVPAIAHVEIVPKVLAKSNEFSRFRYQVILHIHQDLVVVAPKAWCDYEDLTQDSASLEDALHKFILSEEEILAVEKIPNKFLLWEKDVASIVFSPLSDPLVKLETLPSHQLSSTRVAWSAWDLERLAERFGVSLRLSFARQSQDTTLDAVFIKKLGNQVPYIAFKTVHSSDMAIPIFSSRRLEQLNRPSTAHPEREVLKRLKAQLPTYMIPDAIYSTSSLPLLPNGKLDRRQVLAMAEADAGRGFDITDGEESVQPEDALEKRVCDIFQTILSCNPVSPLSDFFSLGGHSLLATRLKAALEFEFSVQFTLREIIAGPTPRVVAAKLGQLRSGISLKKPGPAPGTYHPLSFAQQGLWYLTQLAGPDDVSYNSPLTFNLSGDLQIDILKKTIEEIVLRHQVLRSIFVEVDGIPKVQVLDDMPCLEQVDVPHWMNSDQIHSFVRQYAIRPFRLDSEVPFRATLFTISSSQYILLFSVHHIAWDAPSVDLLRDELAKIYGSLSIGKDHSLPSPNFQYKGFAEWQHSPDFENLVQPQIEYWCSQLLGNQPAELPADYTRPPQLRGEGECYILHCKMGILQQIQVVCQRERVTLFMWMLTVFRVAHYQLTGQEDASFGYPMASRTRPETQKLMGYFVNTQVFRLKVKPGATFLELLRQTRELVLKAFMNQDLPFDRIVSLVNPDRDQARNPLVQMSCTFEATKYTPFTFGGIKASHFPLPWKTSRMDLEVYFKTGEEGLLAEILYSTELFKESTIANLAARIEATLERAIQEPNVSILPVASTIPAVHPMAHDLVDYLRNYVPAEFPLDYSRSATALLETHCFSLPKRTIAALKLLATVGDAKEAALPLVTAFRILQYRYSRTEDAAIGLCLADAAIRPQNTVVVRLPVRGSATLSNVIQETQVAVASALKNSEIPFADVVTVLQSLKKAACESIIRIVLVVQEADNIKDHDILAETHSFDMVWRLQLGGEFTCNLNYNRALFSPRTVQALSEKFAEIVTCLVRSPKITVDEVPFANALEQLIQAQLPVDPPQQLQESSGSLVEAFKLAATNHADRVALVDDIFSITYRELDALSSSLSILISNTPRGQDGCELIAICIPPSALAVLAVMGIIKSGAAYVPLDVGDPPERLRSLLDDCGASLLIITTLSPQIRFNSDRVTCLDITDFLANKRSHVRAQNAEALLTRTELACIIYTSGSAGSPTGVAIRQSSLLALVSGGSIFSFGPPFRVAQISNLTWNASVIEVWCTFLSGATLVCFSRSDILDPSKLAARFEGFEIDSCFMSPTLSRQMLDRAPHIFHSLRTLILGGEPLHYETLRKIRQVNPSVGIHNVFGPTEACAITTIFSISSREEITQSGLVPIGRPLGTAQALVVNARNCLVPPGVPGELIIGGEGVANGYWKRPAEMSFSFVNLKFEGLCASPLTFYRSGDLVKWHSDGQLHFVGSLNAGYVHIQGQKLALSEVEAAILHTGLAKNAAVVCHRPSNAHNSYLVAYITRHAMTTALALSHESSGRPTAEQTYLPAEGLPLQRQILNRLQICLPSFMIPAVIRLVPSLPLTPDGKPDRYQLDAQTAIYAESLRKLNPTGLFEASCDEVEQRLCEIFEQVLQQAPIYRSTDFFGAGGHGLLAQRLTVRIRHAFNVQLKVTDVFTLRTVQAVADRIKTVSS